MRVMTKAWRENIDKFKANGSKVPNRSRQEIIRPKSSWWMEKPEFRYPENPIPPEQHARMRHNTQGIHAGDNF